MDNKLQIQAVYLAFAQGNLEPMLTLMHAETEWEEAAGGPYGGIYTGTEAIMANVFGRIQQEWQSFQVIPQQFIADGDTVVVLGDYDATHGSTEENFTSPFAHVWTLADGKLKRFQQFVDTHLHNQVLP